MCTPIQRVLLIRKLQARKDCPAHVTYRRVQTAASLLTTKNLLCCPFRPCSSHWFCFIRNDLGFGIALPYLYNNTYPGPIQAKVLTLQQNLVKVTTTKFVGNPLRSSILTERRSVLSCAKNALHI